MSGRVMKILGQGHSGIVLAGSNNTVKKYYKAELSWREEKDNLAFLASIQKQDFSIGCKIPKLISSTEGEWQIQGKTYRHCNIMEFIPGKQASSDFNNEQLAILGTNLGSVLFAMHSISKQYVPRWVDTRGDKDELLAHIFGDNAAKVIKVLHAETDKGILDKVKEALAYLQSKEDLLLSNRTLTHIDLNLPNILVNTDYRVQGLVDWGSFGYTNPSLTMYQLATKPRLWGHVKKQYEELGGTVMEDILYAAATIHLAWAPIICAELNLPLPKDETKELFEQMYHSFVNARRKLEGVV